MLEARDTCVHMLERPSCSSQVEQVTRGITLVQDAKMWLKGTNNVSVDMLVEMQEDPVYQHPTSHLSHEEFAQLEFPLRHKISQELFTLVVLLGQLATRD